MKVVDIADELYRELDAPTDLSIPAISFWVRTNLGALNNSINTTFVVNETTLEIKDVDDVEISQQEAAILKKLYFVHFYETKIRSNLGAASTDQIIEISSDGSRIRKVNKTEQGKIYQMVRLQLVEELNQMIAGYKMSESTPLQVAGDDTVIGTSVV
jgi:hypothetical protein